MRSRCKTRGGNLTRFVFMIYRRLELFLQGDQTCGLTFDDITFIYIEVFADDMVILGKDKDDLQTSFEKNQDEVS